MFVVVFSKAVETCPGRIPRDFGRILKCPLRPHHRFQNFRFPRATLQNPKVGSWTEG